MPCRWRCLVGSTGQRNTTTWPWSTPTADWWPSGASVTTRPALASCWRCWPRPATARRRRYRQRHAVSGKKSDHADAVVLANILRTDRAAHRPLPADSELVRAIAVLARAQQDAVWDRTQAHNKLRSLLREFYPAILAAVAGKRGGLLRPEARTILAAAA